MSFRVFEPQPREGVVIQPHAGAVYFPQLGSSPSQDAGRDGQILANQFGIQVAVADRPGSGLLLPHPGLHNRVTNDYTGEMVKIGKVLAHELVDNRSISRVMALGRSAGGHGAIVLAFTDTMPVTEVYAAEPVAFMGVTVEEGRDRVNAYRKEQAARQKATRENAPGSDPLLVLPDPSDTTGLTKISRLLSIPFYAKTEEYHSKDRWASSHAYDLAYLLAKERGDIGITLEFAEHSMIADDYLIHEAREILPLARLDHFPYGKPFVVNQVEHTTHASFDKRSFLAERVRPQLQRLILGA